MAGYGLPPWNGRPTVAVASRADERQDVWVDNIGVCGYPAVWEPGYIFSMLFFKSFAEGSAASL